LDRTEASNPTLLKHYEGLVYKTAARYVGFVEEDFEDIQQILRMKVFRALLSYDPTKSSMTRDRYVFSCIVNQCKDLVKRKKRNELFIEDIAPRTSFDDNAAGGVGVSGYRERFELRYLSTDHHIEYGAIEDDDLVIPSTLTPFERQVVVHLYLHFSNTEIAQRMERPKREVDKAVKSVKEKMADWKPSPETATVVQLRPTLQELREAA
jgi:RNA polymerase sigma factor (sigma-70 family)